MRPVTSNTVTQLLSQRDDTGLFHLIGVGRRGVLRATKLPAETLDADCVWDLEDSVILADPSTAVFAPLARIPPQQRPAVLRRAVEIITTSGHPEQISLIQATGALAALRIPDRTIIDTTIKEAAMPIDLSETAYYQEALARGIAQGEARGRAEGEARGRLRGMLELRFGPTGADVSSQVLEQLALRADPARLIAGAASLDDLVRQLGG